MSSASFSPLNWECPQCQKSYQSNGSLIFLRGTCQHDVCSECILQIVDRVSRKGIAHPRAIKVSCPIDQCNNGEFHVWHDGVVVKRGANDKLVFATTAVKVKKEQSSSTQEVIDLCDEESQTGPNNDHTKPQQIITIKKEKQPTTVAVKTEVKEEETDEEEEVSPASFKKGKVSPPTPSNAKIVSPLPTTKRSNLKPLFDVGDEVFAAWWDPKTDAKRKGKASWYPGRVVSFNEIGHSEYGPTRVYDIKFDDGDRLDLLDDYWVFPKEDYLLTTRFDEMNWKPIGVKKVVDKKSSDRWAKIVGWYSVVIDGQEQSFSLLSDAMKAHDARVVQINGTQTKKSYLNMPEDYPWLFAASAAVKKEVKEEETDDDEESAERPLESKRRRIDTPRVVGFWDAVADPVNFSRRAFMTKPLFHLNSFIDVYKHKNVGFAAFLREGVATPGFAPVPPELARQVPNWTYEQIRDAINDTTYYGENIRSACQVAMWLKDAVIGSFVIMRHEFPRDPFCPARLKENGKYIGPVYVIGVITKKIMPGSAAERDIQVNRLSEFDLHLTNNHTFCLVEWRRMGIKATLEEETKKFINAVCQPTINRMCQDPNKVYKSGATGEAIRRNLWENATIPISPEDFPDVFDVDEIEHVLTT